MTPWQLKQNVWPGESGGDYDALFGFSNRPGGAFSGFNLTDRTVDEALAFANGPYGQWSTGQLGYKATPMGAYQVVGSTLGAAKQGLGLTGNEKMTPELQDQIGMWIYENQGPEAWEAWSNSGDGVGIQNPWAVPAEATMPMTADMARAGEQPNEEPMGVEEFFKKFDEGQIGNGGGGAGGGMVARQQPQDFWSMMGQMPELEGLNQRQKVSATLQDMFSLMRNPDADPYAIQNAMEERVLEEQGRNQTADVLEQIGRPDLAGMVRSGQLDASKAATIAYDLAGRGSGAGGVRYSTTPRVFTDPETGETFTGVMGDDGNIRRLDADVSLGTNKVDAGTHWEIVDKQTGEVIRTVSKNAEEIAANERKIEYRAKLDNYNSNLQEITPVLETIYSMPEGIAAAVGKGDALLSETNLLLDPAGAEFLAYHNQLMGQIFIDAYEQLKGGGQITEIEGLKATQARAAMDRSTTPEAYLDALDAYREALARGQDKLQRLARGEPIELREDEKAFLGRRGDELRAEADRILSGAIDPNDVVVD